MTTEHILYIPSIFLFGFLMGRLSSSSSAFKQTSALAKQSQPNKRRIPGSFVVGSFLVFVMVFIATHVLEIPASTKAVTKSLGGLEIFDRKPSFSAPEVYSRISKFPDTGIRVYKQFTHTVDILFPLTLFTFLILLGRFVIPHFRNQRTFVQLVAIAPIIWFVSDLLENMTVFYLLDKFPTRHNLLAGGLGYVTLTKFAFLLLSILGPVIATVFRRKLIPVNIDRMTGME